MASLFKKQMIDLYDWRRVSSVVHERLVGIRLPDGNYVSDVVDQHARAWCGCCYVVAAAQMIEDRRRIAYCRCHGRSPYKQYIDIQVLLDHFEEDYGDDWNVCHGGFPLDVVECIVDGRCPLVWRAHAMHEWLGHARASKYCDAPSPFASQLEVVQFGRIPPAEVEQEIIRSGPVVLEVSAEVLKGCDARGVVTDLRPREPDHAVTVVGWKNGNWIVRNSWGKERVPEAVPTDIHCVKKGKNDCQVTFVRWRGDPQNSGFVLLPMGYAPLHSSDPSPWVVARVSLQTS